MTERERFSNSETHLPVVKIVFITRARQILLVEHQNGFWILPGGKPKPGEPDKERKNYLTTLYEQTFRKELAREIGLARTQMETLHKRGCQCQISATEWVNQNGERHLDLVWAVYLGPFHLDPQPNHKTTKLHWTDLYHPCVPQGVITPNTQDAISATRLVLAGRHNRGGYFSPSFGNKSQPQKVEGIFPKL